MSDIFSCWRKSCWRKWTDDDRENLFQEYVIILKKLQPKGFLFENVYRIVGAQGGEPWSQIQHRLIE